MNRAAVQAISLAAAGAAGVILAGLAYTQLAYSTSPQVAVLVPVALAVVAVIVHTPIIGVCLALLAMAAESLGLTAGPIGISPTEALLLVTAGASVFEWLRDSSRLRVHPTFVYYGLGILWIAAGIAVARDAAVVERTVLMWSAFGVVALRVSNATPREIRWVLWSLALGAAGASLLALATGGPLEARSGATAVDNRAKGSFAHPNQLAFVLVLAMPAAFVLALRDRVSLRPAFLVITALILAGLVQTLSRGALIGAFASLMIMLWWPAFRRLAAVFIAGLLIFAVLNPSALSNSKDLDLVSRRLSTVTNPGTASVNNARLKIWGTVPAIVADHPLVGIGVGNFPKHSFRYGLSEGGQPFEHAHNLVLSVTVEQGLVGLALYLLVLLHLLRSGLRTLGNRDDPWFPAAFAPLVGLSGLFVVGLTDYPPGNNAVMAVIMISVGLLLAAERNIGTGTPTA